MIGSGFQSYSSSSQWCGVHRFRLKLYSIALISCFITCCPLFAASQYCDNRIDQSYAGLGYGNLEKAQLDTGTGAEVEITTHEVNSAWFITSEPTHSLAIGWDMLYTIMDFDMIKPMTNGNLHTWDLSVIGSHKKNGSEVFYKVTPAISVSSNALRDPSLLDDEALQLKTGLVYKEDLHRKSAWVVGFMSDHRFGDYLLYPVAGVCLQPSEGWLLQLALPDFSIRKTFSSGIRLTLYAAPEGNQWHVFSKDKQRNSDFTYNAIVTGIAAQWPITPTISLSLDFEKQTRREFSFVLDDNSLVELGAGSSTGLTVRGEVLF